MRPFVSVAVLIFCMPVGTLAAQQQTPLQPGSRIRVTVPCAAGSQPVEQAPLARCSVEGEFVTARADTLTLETAGSATTYGLSAVSRLEVSRGDRSHRLVGAGVGFLVGAGVTFVVLHQGGSTSLCDRSANQDAIGPVECLGLAALGGAAGAGLGAVIGGFVRTERWQEVPLERLRITVAPRGAGRVAISVAF